MKGRYRIPVPEDFTAKARECRNVELCKLYGVSESTITDWRKRLNVPARRGWAKGRPKRRISSIDTPEQIRMCLNCKIHFCDGNCTRMKLAKRGLLVCYT